MKNNLISYPFLLVLILSCNTPVHQIPEDFTAPVLPVTDTYHGVEITDHYRYMEDLQSEKVQKWIRTQAGYTSEVLKNLEHKENFFKRLEEVDKGKPYSIYGLQRMKNGEVFYIKRKSDENQGKLYYRDSWSDEERLLLDPEAMSKGKEQH